MEEMKQLTLIPDGTPEQAQAMSLHCEIMATAQAAADSLLALGRKLKQMRDTGGYRHLGFASFGEYTEQAVGIRQRQAYNYIAVVEKVPARLVEENAAAGVTKLALLGKLGPADQREVAGELANITVEELKQIIDERNGMAEQLSMIQDTSRPAAEAESYEVDMEALRAQALEQARAELDAAHKSDLARLREENAHALKQAERAAKEKAESAAARKLAKDRAAAQKEFEQKVEAVRKEQEARDRAALDAARREAEEARAAAEETAKRLQLNASEEGIRFALLFEQLQTTTAQMLDIADSLQDAGRADEAARLRTALAGALQAMVEGLESEVQ